MNSSIQKAAITRASNTEKGRTNPGYAVIAVARFEVGRAIEAPNVHCTTSDPTGALMFCALRPSASAIFNTSG